jgi:hypothetical protein
MLFFLSNNKQQGYKRNVMNRAEDKKELNTKQPNSKWEQNDPTSWTFALIGYVSRSRLKQRAQMQSNKKSPTRRLSFTPQNKSKCCC